MNRFLQPTQALLCVKATAKLILSSLILIGLSVSSLQAQGCNEMNCLDGVELLLGADCDGTVNSYFLLEHPLWCGGPKVTTFFDQNGEPIGEYVSGDYIGQTLDVLLENVWTEDFCWGTVIVVDKRGPDIDCQNININCTQDYSTAALGTPTAEDNCSEVVNFTHEDEEIDFGCGYSGFQEYFGPDNWTLCLPDTGDGGVDVTGAPNSILAEGANNSPVANNCPYIVRYKIEVPTEGIVTFDWSSVGGSILEHDFFYFTIGDTCVLLNPNGENSGTFTSWTVNPGVWISFEVVSNGDPNSLTALIENFNFLTPAIKVIHRTWTAIDATGNENSCTQVITLERASITNVLFPENFDGIDQPPIECGTATSPTFTDPVNTGFPLFDEDGNPATTHDQHPVEGSTECLFDAFYNDQMLDDCDGNFIIARTWTIYDHCTEQTITHNQVIQVTDTTPPVISCPNDITISTDFDGCSATITLPQAVAPDNCSENVQLSAAWAFGAGTPTTYSDVTVGTHPVTYTATDGCGNAASCQMQIMVVDQVPPQAICDGFTVASINDQGEHVLFAESLDDGSYDHCCNQSALSYFVKLSTDPLSAFEPTITFDCTDVGQEIFANMQVKDCNGNASFCTIEVEIHDEQEPVILCPNDATVDCGDDVSNLNQFGQPTVIDNCAWSLSEQDNSDLSNCGTGIITRTFSAIDPSGNVAVCTQNINIDNLTPWNANNNQINFPPDYFVGGECDALIEPTDLAAPFNEPTFTGQMGCEMIATSYEDAPFTTTGPNCYKILRTWTVIDWCVHTLGSDEGIWEGVQVIEVVDNVQPLFLSVPEAMNVAPSNSEDCTANVTFSVPETQDCDDNVSVSFSSSFGNQFGTYSLAVGSYIVTYIAFDACGNASEYSYEVTINDDVAPNASCLNGLNIDIPEEGEITLNASTFNALSSDNCTANNNLNFSFSNDPFNSNTTFDCDDLGNIPVELWVTDENGNQSSCATSVIIEDPSGNCIPPATEATILGIIYNEEDEMVNMVDVALSGSQTNNTQTELPGTYDFQNVLIGGDYTITPFKDINLMNGVTTLDLVKINDHILGNELFDSPYKIIAADVNQSGSITAFDMVQIRRLILAIDTEFKSSPSWRFVDAAYEFPLPNAPFSPTFPEHITVNNFQEDLLAANFVGVKVGDVNNSSNSANLTNDDLEDRDNDDLVIWTENTDIKAGETYTVTFSADAFEDILAYQTTIEFKAAQLIFSNLIPSSLPFMRESNFGYTHLIDGKITTLWVNEERVELEGNQELFHLQFVAAQDGKLSELLSFNADLTDNIAYNTEERAGNVVLEFRNPDTTTPTGEGETEDDNYLPSHFYVGQNYPNPFMLKTTLPFELPEANEVTFSFFNRYGVFMQEMTAAYPAGRNSIVIDRRALKEDGLIFCKVSYKDEVKTVKFLPVRQQF